MARGLSLFQIAAVFCAIAAFHLVAEDDDDRATSATIAALRVFTRLRGLAAIVLFSAAALLMSWPPDGSLDDMEIGLLTSSAAAIVSGFVAVRYARTKRRASRRSTPRQG